MSGTGQHRLSVVSNTSSKTAERESTHAVGPHFVQHLQQCITVIKTFAHAFNTAPANVFCEARFGHPENRGCKIQLQGISALRYIISWHLKMVRTCTISPLHPPLLLNRTMHYASARTRVRGCKIQLHPTRQNVTAYISIACHCIWDIGLRA